MAYFSSVTSGAEYLVEGGRILRSFDLASPSIELPLMSQASVIGPQYSVCYVQDRDTVPRVRVN